VFSLQSTVCPASTVEPTYTAATYQMTAFRQTRPVEAVIIIIIIIIITLTITCRIIITRTWGDECSPPRQVAANLCTKTIGLNHKPACRLLVEQHSLSPLLAVLLSPTGDTHFTVPRRVEG